MTAIVLPVVMKGIGVTVRVRVGKYEAIWLRDTPFMVDGGTMFHIIPKTLWEKKIATDDRNRVKLGLNCLVLRGEGKTILYDAGVGNKLGDKHKAIYGLDPAVTLIKSLAAEGIAPSEIDVVVPSHLHLDHAGWLTVWNGGGLVPAFPRARHVVQNAEWKAAHEVNELTAGSYMRDDFDPLRQYGLLDIVSGDCRVAPSVTAVFTGAHSAGHQVLRAESGGEVLVCPCEMIPTSLHLRPAWITSYDLEPAKVLEIKKQIMRDAAEQGRLLFLSHDPANAFGRINALSGGEYGWEPLNPVSMRVN